MDIQDFSPLFKQSKRTALKPLMMRAEGCIVLLRKDNLPKVAERLKAFSYLL